MIQLRDLKDLTIHDVQPIKIHLGRAPFYSSRARLVRLGHCVFTERVAEELGSDTFCEPGAA